MSQEAFHQHVRMAAVQVAGLSPDELRQALAYEVEPFSGIPAAEADVEFAPVDDADASVRVFDVTVRRRRAGGSPQARASRALSVLLTLGAVILVGIAVDGGRLAYRLSAVRREVHARRPLQAQLDRLAQEARAVQAETAQVRARREAEIRAQDDAANLRAAPALALADLTVAFESRAALKSITADAATGAWRVSAIATSSATAADVMRRLANDANPHRGQDALALPINQPAARAARLIPGAITINPTASTVTFDFTLHLDDNPSESNQ